MTDKWDNVTNFDDINKWHVMRFISCNCVYLLPHCLIIHQCNKHRTSSTNSANYITMFQANAGMVFCDFTEMHCRSEILYFGCTKHQHNSYVRNGTNYLLLLCMHPAPTSNHIQIFWNVPQSPYYMVDASVKFCFQQECVRVIW